MIIQPLGDPPTAPISPVTDISRNADVNIPFVMEADAVTFAPEVFPNTLRGSKKRNLNRSSNFCGGEDVSDQGAKNKEIHVSGYVKQRNTGAVWDVVNTAAKIELTSPIWSGEVRVKQADLEGPSGFDPESGTYYFQYTFDIVSTGLDEPEGGVSDSGIIDEGDENDETDATDRPNR